MIGIVVVSHGKLAKELILAAEHVVGKQGNIKSICIDPEDDMEVKRSEIIDAAKAVDNGKGIVILTDMFGGSNCWG
jgi:PTS system mannose-specific IIA component